MPGLNLESLFTTGGVAGEAFGLAGELVNAPIRRAQLEDERAAAKDARNFRDTQFESQQLDVFGNQLLQQRGQSMATLKSQRAAGARQAAAQGFKPAEGLSAKDPMAAIVLQSLVGNGKGGRGSRCTSRVCRPSRRRTTRSKHK